MSGKFVRSETGIAQGAVSISSAAVELAVLKCPEDVGVPLKDARVTIIGAGKMSRLLITHLASHGVTKLPLLKERVWGAAAAPPLIVIDISVPRNVEAQCNELDAVKAYNVDDLKQVVARNQARRRHKILEAEALLRVELAKFEAWQESLKYG